MEAIYEAGGELVFAMTLEDNQAVKKSGRVFIDDFCQKKDISLLKTSHINNQVVVSTIKELSLDWLFVIGWSQIASKEILSAPKYGVLGIHPTLLPKGRGRASIPWAILKRLPKTGVSMFKLDKGVDTGPVVGCVEIPLSDKITAAELYELVNNAHSQLIMKVIPQILNNTLSFSKQNEGQATEWPGRAPEDGEIDLTGSVFDAECLIRAVTHPYPGAFIKTSSNKKLVVWSAKVVNEKSTGYCIPFKDGYLELQEYEVIES